ncbi:MAG TPA: hypothetical protein DCX07_14045 [Phycisphaerales bacterium]|nr:hypothetical protein [Phycisphaerales bacterium]
MDTTTQVISRKDGRNDFLHGSQGDLPDNGIQRRIRILIYGRFSTEEQNCRSCRDQHEYCRDWLERQGVPFSEILIEADEGIPGERLDRPGIDRVRNLIRSRQIDMLVGEDVSRFYRDRGEPYKLAGECVDHGIRFVAVNDGVDTNKPDWQSTLSRVSEEHAAHNDKLSLRIKRASLARWKNGEAMGPLAPGYQRIPVDPVQHERTRRGPYKDEKDEQWASTIEELFQRCARGDPPDRLAEFLNVRGFPTRANSQTRRWAGNGVKNLIKNYIYKGHEQYRETFSKKHFGSGRRQAERSAPDAVWFRPMPHLRFVSDLLWQQANDAIARRDRGGSHPQGQENPLYRVPRNSRSPLANHFFCAACGSKMITQGRNDGG